MKKALLLAVMAAITLPLLFSASANSTFEMTGYRFKEVELPQLRYTVTVKAWTQAEITGQAQILNITNAFQNQTLRGVFSINIKSNRKTDIPVEIEFYPFIKEADQSKKAGIKYNFYTDPFVTVTGQSYGNRTGSRWSYTYYFYRFTPSLKLTSDGIEINETTALTVGASGATATMVHSVAKAEQATSQSTSVPTNASSWSVLSNTSSIADVLPFGTNSQQVLETTGYFVISMDSSTYNAMDANVDYYATVRLTFTSI